MSQVTAEQARAAAEVIRKLNRMPTYHEECAWSPNALENHAAYLEREQAEKARGDKRVEELAAEVLAAERDPNSLFATWERRVAVFLLDRYPSLLNEGGER